MKKAGLALVALLGITGCGLEDKLKDALEDAKNADPVKGAPGIKAAQAGFAAASQVVGQVNGIVGAGSDGRDGASIPSINPETKKDTAAAAPGLKSLAVGTSATGFDGPVAGPDGTDGWYKQTYTHVSEYGTAVTSSYDIFIKADPAADLATSWPTLVKKMNYAWVGTEGYYAGYKWTSDWEVYDDTHVKGSWKFEVGTSEDVNSYSKYWTGSHYEGQYDLAGDALGDGRKQDGEKEAPVEGTQKLKVDLENKMNYSLHFANYYDYSNTSVPLTTPKTTDWYGTWSWTMNFDITSTYAAGVTTMSGPVKFATRVYYGQGTDPMLTGIPEYAEGATVQSGVWADETKITNGEYPTGLYYYMEGLAEAQSDFKQTRSATEESVVGTCSGKGTSMSYEGGPACVVETTDCKEFFRAAFPYCQVSDYNK